MAKPDGLYAFDVESGSTVATLGSGPVNTIGNLRESIFAVEADNLLVQNDGDLSSQFNPVSNPAVIHQDDHTPTAYPLFRYL